jgi:hypothetical protein
MKHDTNIPENFEKMEELSELLDSILNTITIDNIISLLFLWMSTMIHFPMRSVP